MPIHVHKKGIRALGISESFVKGTSHESFLAGIVMRADMVLDGFSISKVNVGGMNATQQIIEMFQLLDRDDINVLLLNGCVISWYNVIDLHYLSDLIDLPLICVTYRESTGLEEFFQKYFPHDWRSRVEVYHRNGPRIPITLKTGHVVYIRFLKIDQAESVRVLNKFTLHGAIPEPLRIARLLARTLIRFQTRSNVLPVKTY